MQKKSKLVSGFKAAKLTGFGSDAPIKRTGEPTVVATAYLLLASKNSSYITGQVIHPNGGEIING